MHILVTGATGFVGKEAVSLLAKNGHSVRAAIRDKSRWVGLIPAIDDIVEIGEIGPETDWSSALKGIDGVLHLAAHVHQMGGPSPDNDRMFRRVNIEGSQKLAEDACLYGCERFVFVSSIKVNGEATGRGEAFKETDPPQPEDAYGKSKAEAETGLADLSRRTGLSAVTVRPPLIVGPGAPGNLARLRRMIELGIPLPFGRIRNRRSMIGLRSFCHLLERTLVAPTPAPLYLAADIPPLSTADLVRSLAEGMGKPAKLIPVPSSCLVAAARVAGRGEEIKRLTDSLEIDASKARQDLDWQSPQTIFEAVREFGASPVPVRI